MSDWGRCEKCGKCHYLPHGCKLYEVSRAERDHDWREVYATDAEEAAERWAEEDDCYGDYTIIQAGDGGDTQVLVRLADEPANVVRCHVYGETVAQYHARELPPAQEKP